MGISHSAWGTLKGSDELWETSALLEWVICELHNCGLRLEHLLSLENLNRFWSWSFRGANLEGLAWTTSAEAYFFPLPQPVTHYPDGKTEFCSLSFRVFFSSPKVFFFFFPRLYDLFKQFSLWNDNCIVWVKCQEPLFLSTQWLHNLLQSPVSPSFVFKAPFDITPYSLFSTSWKKWENVSFLIICSHFLCDSEIWFLRWGL